MVVLDNVHRVDAEALQSLVRAAPGVRFLCIGQPWSGAALIEAVFGIQAEHLGGWALDDIAAEFAAEQAPATIRQAEVVRRLTGGLPLYVRSAAVLTARAYEADVEAFCAAIEARANDTATAQEIILDASFVGLDATSRKTAAVLGLSETPLSRQEAFDLLKLAGVGEVDAGRAIRGLRRSSIVVGFQGDRLGLHDAVRVLAIDHGGLNEDERDVLLKALAVLLRVSLQRERDVVRLGFLMRLLPRIGQVDVLVDLAGDEMFYEQGDPGALRREIEAAADDTSKGVKDRFWAQDSLAYWESRDGGQPDRRRLDIMTELVAQGRLGPREQMALVFKELAYWGTEGNLAEIGKAYRAGAALKVEADIVRLLRYNYAIALNRGHQPGKAKTILEGLITEYYAVAGTSEQAATGKNGPAFLALLKQPIDHENCKRLGDCLSLWSIIVVGLGMYPGLRRIAAMKFFGAGQAARSAVSTGQELADDFLDGMGDAKGAVDVMEQHVLPMMREAQLTDLVIPVRSHYAIALAYAGRMTEARREIAALIDYAGDPEQIAMLRERAQVIEEVASGRRRVVPRPPSNIAGPKFLPTQRVVVKVGRNDPCPCGSGEKFKRCCA
ncbi:SEC-C metal-binding domain-containing protein [Caulobacter sp. UC70_42]|uniref:YecA family protein n=1 Tax=Caulobacter sp. UC70_42 TaxID=3374551 RepID=UPI003758171C